MSDQKTLSPLWWLWVPVGAMALQILLEIFLSSQILSALHSENGPHESLQFLVMLGALFVAVFTLLRMQWAMQKWLGAWLVLAAVCCAYVAGEEVSWGQHVLEWSTPDFWMNVNDQGETNLHNTSSWLDQKPRLILLIGIVSGGLVIPFLQKRRSQWIPDRFNIIYPPKEMGVIALLVVVPQLIEKLFESFDISVFERFSEVQELYMFYFVLLYVLALRNRVIS